MAQPIAQPGPGPSAGTDVLCSTHKERWDWVTLGSGFKGVASPSQPPSIPANCDSGPAAEGNRKARQVAGGQYIHMRLLSTYYVLSSKGYHRGSPCLKELSPSVLARAATEQQPTPSWTCPGQVRDQVTQHADTLPTSGLTRLYNSNAPSPALCLKPP